MCRLFTASEQLLAHVFIKNKGSFTYESITPGSAHVSLTGNLLMAHHRICKTRDIILKRYTSTRNSIHVLILVLRMSIMVCYIKRSLTSGIFNCAKKHQELVMEYKKSQSHQTTRV